MHECFIHWEPQTATVEIIDEANKIIQEMMESGYRLTVRQLFYQLVARDLVPNTQKSYKRIASIASKARMAGMMDWDAIEDRTRFLRRLPTWGSPYSMIAGCIKQYREDIWAEQRKAVEVWIEKDALVGVIEPACNQWRVPVFSCRGYPSQTAIYRAVKRHNDWLPNEEVVVLYLTDHDPSGLDMVRDVEDRMWEMNGNATIERIALTRSQIDEIGAPPNPAKITDSRARKYISRHGYSSWELDAIPPKMLSDLVSDAIENHVVKGIYYKSVEWEKRGKQKLADARDWLARGGKED